MIVRPLLVATGLVLAAAVGPALAQTAAQPAAKAPAAKPAAAKPAPKPAGLPDASDNQLAASQMAYYGDYRCEFDQKLSVSVNKTKGGYVDVAFKGRTYVMKPVLSSTGALRLEDVTGRTLMIQIASKSMLMDTKAGQRLVDECVHPDQQVKTAQAPATATN